jgi:hypothetical protein
MSNALFDEESRSLLLPFTVPMIGSGLFSTRSQTGFLFQIRPQVGSSRSIRGCSMFGYNKAELIDRDIETLSSGVHPYI